MEPPPLGEGVPPGSDPEPAPPDDLSERIEAVEDAFLESLLRGEADDPAVVAALHPELGPWLGPRLSLLRLAQGGEEGTEHADLAFPERIGRFEVMSVLGLGSFGAVYEGHDTRLDRRVAIKVLRTGPFASDDEKERFLREARSAAQLEHPGIVSLYEIGEDGGAPFLVSELIHGQTLAETIAKSRPSPRETARIVAAIARALEHAHHHGIIHRDLKPANILVDVEGKPHVMDFGLARRTEESGQAMTLDGEVLGTPSYMAPEQARGEPSRIGERSDVYGIGATLYELLVGEPPFRGSRSRVMYQVVHEDVVPPRRVDPGVPRDLETICLRAMQKEPAHRYPSAAEMADDLERFLRGEPIRARPTGRLERTWRWYRRNPVVASLLALVVLLVLGALAGSNLVLIKIRGENSAKEAALEKSRLQLAQAAVQRGFQGLEAEDPSRALPWLVRGLELSQGDPARERPHRIRIGTTLRRCAPLTQACYHEDAVVAAEFDASGERFVTASADRTARIWSTDTGDPLGPPLRHEGPVSKARFAPDGARVATSSRDGTARLWISATGEPSTGPLAHLGPVLDIGFSPDGARVVTSSQDGTARLWNAGNGRQMGQPLEHKGDVVAACFGPDGQRVLTASADHAARIWEAATGALLFTLWHEGPVNFASFSVDGRFAVSGSQDGVVRVWNTATGERFGASISHGRPVLHAVSSPCGSVVATTFASPLVTGNSQVWSLAGKKLAASARHQGPMTYAAFSADGRLLASASRDGTVLVWDWKSGANESLLLVHAGSVATVAFHPDGRRLLTASADGAARLWDLAAPARGEIVLRPGKTIRNIDAGADGKAAITSSIDGTARVWELSTGETLGGPLRQGKGILWAALSPDGRVAAIASKDGTARLWDVISSSPLGDPLAHGAEVHIARFSPDGSILATGCLDGEVAFWDTRTGLRKAPSLALGGLVKNVAFSPDGKRFIAGSGSGILAVIDLERGMDRPRILQHGTGIRHSVFHPDGNRLLTGGEDGTAQLWDASSGKAIGGRLRHSAQTISSAAFSQDGLRVVTASFDGTARIWNVDTGAPASPRMQQRSLVGVAFSDDGRLVATLCRLGGTRVWDSASGEQLTADLGEVNTIVGNAVFLCSDRKLLASGPDNTWQTWDVTPDERPIREMAWLATVHSARTIDGTDSLIAAEPSDVRRAWEELRKSHSRGMPVLPEQAAAWHLNQSFACELSGDIPGATFHLDQAIRLAPGSARVEARRRRVGPSFGPAVQETPPEPGPPAPDMER